MAQWPAIINFGLFCLLAGVLWAAGTWLSWFIDAIAERTRLGRIFAGMVLLATATSLPEIATTVSAAARDVAALALNNLFGGIAMQTAVLALTDAWLRRRTLSSCTRDPTLILQAVLLIIALCLALGAAIFVDTGILGSSLGIAGLAAPAFYLVAMYLIRQAEGSERWSPVDLPDEKQEASGGRENRFDESGLKKLVIWSLLASLAILACGFFLVRTAETLAEQTGLGSSFIGITLLALSTSLPEVSTTIAAVRVKAYNMAVSNILGSNLIMVFLILPADAFYRQGPIMNQADGSAVFALLAGIVVTAVLAAGLLLRSERRVLGMGLDTFAVLLIYLATLPVFYYLR